MSTIMPIEKQPTEKQTKIWCVFVELKRQEKIWFILKEFRLKWTSKCVVCMSIVVHVCVNSSIVSKWSAKIKLFYFHSRKGKKLTILYIVSIVYTKCNKANLTIFRSIYLFTTAIEETKICGRYETFFPLFGFWKKILIFSIECKISWCKWFRCLDYVTCHNSISIKQFSIRGACVLYVYVRVSPIV